MGLYPQAMMLKTKIGEEYLSVNWLEHWPGTRATRLKNIVEIHRRKAKSGRPLSQESGIAVLRTGGILEIGASHDRRLRVVWTRTKEDPSYSRISGLPLDNSDQLLIASLVEEAYRDFMLLRDVDALP
jgi:hypothetical protein